MWLPVFFIIEPVNVWLGRHSLLKYLANRDWRALLALWTAVLLCGFFWEMWNLPVLMPLENDTFIPYIYKISFPK
jgi:hypothetical protein